MSQNIELDDSTSNDDNHDYVADDSEDNINDDLVMRKMMLVTAYV